MTAPAQQPEQLARMIELCCKYPDIPDNCDRCEYSPKEGMRKGCCDFGYDDICKMLRSRQHPLAPMVHKDCDNCHVYLQCKEAARAATLATYKRTLDTLESLCMTRQSRYEDPEEPEDRKDFLRGMMEGTKMARLLIRQQAGERNVH
jgi:hypothetical protein